jgi:hypothetical protein
MKNSALLAVAVVVLLSFASIASAQDASAVNIQTRETLIKFSIFH